MLSYYPGPGPFSFDYNGVSSFFDIEYDKFLYFDFSYWYFPGPGESTLEGSARFGLRPKDLPLVSTTFEGISYALGDIMILLSIVSYFAPILKKQINMTEMN